ncbi:MAG: trehalose-phosphatase [Anaerolineae bacterium]|nr:trehalose-phosphatase [Anaerolineae bacterium]
MTTDLETLNRHLADAGRVRLFLDYDGTLADFAPTPDHVTPDPAIISLLTSLVKHPHFKVAIISGRRLEHVQKLVPVPGILLAGTYGIELQTPDGKHVDRAEYDIVRPILDDLKPRWQELIAGHEGFYLEDKDWAMAIHASFAVDDEADQVLASARHMAVEAPASAALRVLGGHKFLEIGPRLAHKGRTVEYLLDRYPWPGALPLYVGDDDKDEEAFEVIKTQGGIAILVSSEPRDTVAEYRLDAPRDTRRWLKTLSHSI